MMNMYQENILDHNRSPRNYGKIEDGISRKEVNMLCGDEIEVSMKIEGSRISDVKFKGEGCAISQASASIFIEYIKGKKLEEVKSLQKEDILEMLGIPISPTRLKCALLVLYAIKECLEQNKC